MKVIANNKKVAHDYYILERYECGIALTGTEIKSIRMGKVAINDAYARIKDYELWLISMHIAKYDKGNIFNHEEKRDRKLLMQKHDIIRLYQKLKTQGLTLIPTKVYLTDNNLCKVELALCKGKKMYDKRETAKAEDSERRLNKTVRDYQA